MKVFKVAFIWNDGDDRWHTSCEELGLTLEHGSFDALVERVKIAAPEMAELNFNYTGEIQLVFEIRRELKLKVVSA
jgi:hypothetical protein